ncbi:hypothetical protein K438DRAFT_379197 [Mycena galopus ATCC 62051]|nr:hypothetical protein K438DRAFT_379197 [Mycena galopus ATCC 62051]
MCPIASSSTFIGARAPFRLVPAPGQSSFTTRFQPNFAKCVNRNFFHMGGRFFFVVFGLNTPADRARVADLDTEILLLEQALSAMRIQKDQAQRRLDSYKYSVLTLPNEIISEILVHFLPIHPQYFAGLDSPILLTQICRE